MRISQSHCFYFWFNICLNLLFLCLSMLFVFACALSSTTILSPLYVDSEESKTFYFDMLFAKLFVLCLLLTLSFSFYASCSQSFFLLLNYALKDSSESLTPCGEPSSWKVMLLSWSLSPINLHVTPYFCHIHSFPCHIIPLCMTTNTSSLFSLVLVQCRWIFFYSLFQRMCY